ncbi:MAG: hypothetical protein J0I33_03835 [Microbacterium ginsengisoli]|jgi:hypothetical protein|uniref:hypothetical protein n=1 Tax=Microbacterium TaxID=33882 RepID=UPI0006FD4CC9|nr:MULTISPECIES: hypothetical protein [unclassified Microbacterium]KQR92138.1 hypothetical protein ASF93_05935 [Microbacterium sp. Leaf347]KQS05885.1 hypothetical protein ASG00_07795 [Microbacterium sp. Leaf351]MBN9197752.1 hypothetical protein [Microbacterium ginsengisoli]OJU79331.1 MAG: hypothetical protein BGO15_10500 [Microbacterium sp. 71-23]
MTLTSLLPTLRDSLPAPLAGDAWPARTHATTRDVVIAGVSVLRYAELCGTPCVTTAPAIVPLSGGVPSATASTSVLVAAVTGCDDGMLRLDARLDELAPCWAEARLLGRISHAAERRWRLGACTVVLPADLGVGDVVALPCPGAVGLGDIRPR